MNVSSPTTIDVIEIFAITNRDEKIKVIVFILHNLVYNLITTGIGGLSCII